jgi:hypothetical protein
MTLILTCATPQFALQVSDRRVTWVRGPHAGHLADDARNKALVIGGHLAFAYTGLAEIGVERTDDWLLGSLEGIQRLDIRTVSERIAAQASGAFATLPLSPAEKRHAFVGVGWMAHGTPPRDLEPERAQQALFAALRPAIVAISNALDDRWDWLSEAEATFRILVRHLAVQGGGPLAFASAGAALTPGESADLTRVLNRLTERVHGAVPYLRVLAAMIRRVAARTSTVGRDLMVTLLPRNAVGRTGVTIPLGGTIPADAVSTFYLPDGSRTPLQYGPHYFDRFMQSKGMQVITGGDHIGPVDEGEVPLFFGGPLVLSLAWRPSVGAPLRVRLAESDAYPGLKYHVLVEPGPQHVAVEAPTLLRVSEDDPRIMQVRQDARFIVLTGPLADPMAPPDAASVARLLAWLRRWGAEERAVSDLASRMAAGANRAAIAYHVRALLRTMYTAPGGESGAESSGP